MTITQTIEVPADHRVFLEFLAPKEIPAGTVQVEMKLTPVDKKQVNPLPAKGEKSATPITDELSGILSSACNISLEEIRAERLQKYLK